MITIADTTDEAISGLKKGLTLEEVLSLYPDNRIELESLLHTAMSLAQMPKAQIPTPAMQRKFLTTPKPASMWIAWLHISRFAAVSASVMLLIAGISGTTYAAFKSLPGQVLFPLKRTAEKIQVNFAKNPETKASLQVAFTQQRLMDTKQIFNTPDHTLDQEKAALKELSDQTKETMNTVTSVQTTSSLEKKDHPLVASLMGLAKQQEELLNQIKPKTDTHTDVTVAANKALAANQEVNNFIIAATSEPGIMANLSASSSVVTVSGIISKLSKTEISVDKQSFIITNKTVILSGTTTPASLNDLTLKTLASVQGIKNASGTTATTITLVKNNADGIVKGEYTENSIAAGSKTNLDNNLFILNKKGESKSPVNDSVLIPSTTEAIGTFIVEDPAPQFAP